MIYAAVVIRLIYHYHIALSFVSVSWVSLPVLLLLFILYRISRTTWSMLLKQHYASTVIIGVLLLFFSIYALSYNLSLQRFDYNRWVGYPEQRALMVNDFLQEHNLVGLTPAEVMDLLGASDSANRADDDDDTVVYDLGALRRMDYKSEKLFIYLNERGYVKSYEIVTR